MGHHFGCADIVEHPIKSLSMDCDKVPNTFKLSSTVHIECLIIPNGIQCL